MLWDANNTMVIRRKSYRAKFQVTASVLEYCNMVARKSTSIQLKCGLGNQYFDLLTELATQNLISKRQIGARFEYITTPLGREWLHHYYALMRLQGEGDYGNVFSSVAGQGLKRV